MPHEYFEHLMEYQLAVCRECRHAVWPDEIEGHLQGKHHKLKRKKAQEIADEVRSWPGLIPFASELEVPARIDRPIQQLPLYEDGWLCQLDEVRCQYVCRDKRTLEWHWSKVHQWSVRSGRRGGSGKAKKEMVERRIKEGAKRVHCQRFFPSRGGSQYFEVRQPEQAWEDQARAVEGQALWNQIRSRAEKCWAEMEKKSLETVQEGEKDEVNPWLERTGWHKYLKGLNMPKLFDSVEEPNSDPEAEEEPVEAAIWKVMGEVAEISQASVTNRIGVFVRMEAIRTEQHQTQYQPLQPYMEEDSIKDYVRPWRQVLMFFARTQREHDWSSPNYRFTRGQQRAWEKLVEEARREVNEESDEGSDEEMGESDSEDDYDENDQQPKPLTRIQKACLDFCMELLNQTISRREYDSALVCALAVLGVGEKCDWKGPDSYPQILSAMIKIARFMVVQKALEISDPVDEFIDESPYDFDSGYDSQPMRRCKGCLDFLEVMMDKFMVRGSHSPMQWMLDLRTYGLKIHYNTTATGHIGWQGQDELLYKDIQFNMSQFRGMVHGLVAQTRRLLEEELLFCGDKYAGEEVPEVPWKSLRDNPTDGRTGWNFLQDQRTKWPVEGKSWLFDRIGRNAAIRERFSRVESSLGVRREGVEAYMRQVAKFKEKLLILMHITGMATCLVKIGADMNRWTTSSGTGDSERQTQQHPERRPSKHFHRRWDGGFRHEISQRIST